MEKDNRTFLHGCGSWDHFEGNKLIGIKEKKCKDCKVNDIETWKQCHCTPIKIREDDHMTDLLTAEDIKNIDSHIRYLAIKRNMASGADREHLENIIHWLLRYEKTCREDSNE